MLDVLINGYLDGIAACYLAYVPVPPTDGYLYLVDDAGDGGYTTGSPALLSSGGILANDQCLINLSNSSASAGGNGLALSLALQFSPGFVGNQIICAAARNNSTGNNGWQAVGSVPVP